MDLGCGVKQTVLLGLGTGSDGGGRTELLRGVGVSVGTWLVGLGELGERAELDQVPPPRATSRWRGEPRGPRLTSPRSPVDSSAGFPVSQKVPSSAGWCSTDILCFSCHLYMNPYISLCN
jgi:hypothetical protein